MQSAFPTFGNEGAGYLVMLQDHTGCQGRPSRQVLVEMCFVCPLLIPSVASLSFTMSPASIETMICNVARQDLFFCHWSSETSYQAIGVMTNT